MSTRALKYAPSTFRSPTFFEALFHRERLGIEFLLRLRAHDDTKGEARESNPAGGCRRQWGGRFARRGEAGGDGGER